MSAVALILFTSCDFFVDESPPEATAVPTDYFTKIIFFTSRNDLSGSAVLTASSR